MQWDDDWDDSDHEVSADARAWGPGEQFGTEDAARIGLDRNTLEGAQLAFFSHLDGTKASHRLIALVCLLVLAGWPMFVAFERIKFALQH